MRGDIEVGGGSSGAEKPEWLLRRLEWFRSLQFGVILHWGPYAQWDCCESWPLVPGDQWARNENLKCWTERGQDIGRFQQDYWALADTFQPDGFDANEWAAAFAAAGAKYVCFTTKHHDGFCLWDTQTTDYKVQRDFTRELFEACRAFGLAVSVYFSKADWHCPAYWDPADHPQTRHATTSRDPVRWGEFVRFTHEQIRELMTGYGPIDILWLDAGWVTGVEDLDMPGLVAMARALQPGLIVANRAVGDEFEDFVTPEREVPLEEMSGTWEVCMPLCPDWKYVAGQVPRSAGEVVMEMNRVNGAGGNYLLGIGPRADGRLDPAQEAVLREIGRLRG